MGRWGGGGGRPGSAVVVWSLPAMVASVAPSFDVNRSSCDNTDVPRSGMDPEDGASVSGGGGLNATDFLAPVLSPLERAAFSKYVPLSPAMHLFAAFPLCNV